MKKPSKRLEQLSCVFAGITAIYLTIVLVIGRFWAHSPLIQSLTLPLLLAFIYCVIAWWHYRLGRLHRAELAITERIREEHDPSNLFDDEDLSLTAASDALSMFHRTFLPYFTAALSILLLGILFSYYRALPEMLGAIGDRDSLGIAGLSMFLFIFSLLTASYINGVSREVAENRWLRPAAAWLYVASAGLLVGTAVLLAEHSQLAAAEPFASKLAVAVFAILLLELSINVIIEFYRPRMDAVADRPIYESRLVSLLIEPGGIAKNVAYTLDYQFGFKLSESWFYRFLERAFIPYLLLLIALLYLLDCVVLIDATELGFKERFGRPVSEQPITPGIYFKFPAPIERISTYSVSPVRSVTVGLEGHHADEPRERGDREGGGEIVLWNNSHHDGETNFLVASRPSIPEAAANDGGDRNEPLPEQNLAVNILTASIPIYYRLDAQNLFHYAYGYNDTELVLQNIATRETVRYLASVDFVDMIGYGRLDVKSELETRIRAAVEQQDPPLGVEILFVGLMDVHPSIEVADTYQQFTAAAEQHTQAILDARSAVDQEVIIARGMATSIVLDSEAYRYSQRRIAEGEAARFVEQMKAYAASPAMYKLRNYLNLLEDASQDIRKYIVATSSKQVVEFDLKERLRPDLLEDFVIEAE